MMRSTAYKLKRDLEWEDSGCMAGVFLPEDGQYIVITVQRLDITNVRVYCSAREYYQLSIDQASEGE